MLVIDLKDRTVEYAGANNPLHLFREGMLTEYRADKMPIGIQEQRSILEKALDDWKSDTDQIDDILVMGIRM